MKWIALCAFCAAVFIGSIGITIAAQTDTGPEAARIKEQKIQQLLDAGRAHLQQKGGSQNHVPVPQPAPVRHPGIIGMRQGPFSSSFFTVRNMWQGKVGSAWILAYAGAKTNPDGTSGPGGVILYTETANAQGTFDLHPLKVSLAPVGTSVLTITAVNGDLLLLRSQDGAQLTFNLTTYRFH